MVEVAEESDCCINILVGIELRADFLGHMAQRFDAAHGMLLFVLGQGRLHILGREDRDHDGQLHLPGAPIWRVQK